MILRMGFCKKEKKKSLSARYTHWSVHRWDDMVSAFCVKTLMEVGVG